MLVQELTTEVYMAKLGMSEEQRGEAWIPSIQWVHRFLSKQCGLTPRRVAGSSLSPEATAKGEVLHRITQEQLALFLDHGGKERNVVGADEFGLFVFPQAKWQWAVKGSETVRTAVGEDRRQLTGDVAHTYAGAVLKVHLIQQGKTTAVLPSMSKRAAYPMVHHAFTDNH